MRLVPFPQTAARLRMTAIPRISLYSIRGKDLQYKRTKCCYYCKSCYHKHFCEWACGNHAVKLFSPAGIFSEK